MPKRIQRQRARGWRMPAGVVYVGRPTIFGNPFGPPAHDSAEAVRLYREWIEGRIRTFEDLPANARNLHVARAVLEVLAERRAVIVKALARLRGKDLACWCAEGEPCHADVLLDVANRPGIPFSTGGMHR